MHLPSKQWRNERPLSGYYLECSGRGVMGDERGLGNGTWKSPAGSRGRRSDHRRRLGAKCNIMPVYTLSVYNLLVLLAASIVVRTLVSAGELSLSCAS